MLHRPATAGYLSALYFYFPVMFGDADVDEADGFFLAAAAGPGHARNRDSQRGVQAFANTDRHRDRDFFADRSVALDVLGCHVEQVDFGLVRVRYDAAAIVVGCAGLSGYQRA